MTTFELVYQNSKQYYENKLKEGGCSPAGVDWKDKGSQYLRFKKLLEIVNLNESFSIADIGCGYGELFLFLNALSQEFQYYGIDVSSKMIEEAKCYCKNSENVKFIVGHRLSQKVDYCVASGIFNTRGELKDAYWMDYIFNAISSMNESSVKGFSFNCLTSYSDEDKKRKDLYYTDPLVLFDFCKKNFSKRVALLHDYPLYEFTVLVRKENE
jgi:SAM-dependent methyltransferase